MISSYNSKESITEFGLPKISVKVTAAFGGSCQSIDNSAVSSPPMFTSPTPDTPTITKIVLSALEGVQSGIPTRTTSTLTPTRLRNIEQIFEFEQLGSPPQVHSYQAGFVPPPVQPQTGNSYISVDSKAWGGGVTTLTRPSISSSSSRDSLSPALSCSPMPSLISTENHSTNKKRMGGRRPMKDERLSPEEEQRRYLRRERNKQAAARCRKRRLDQTSMLQEETDDLEGKRSSLQQEILLLKQQREELEFLLAAHKPTCKKGIRSKIASSTNECFVSTVPSILSPYDRPTEIKVEMMDHDLEQENEEPRPSRPTSLSLNLSKQASGLTKRGVPSDLGISIETPSSGLRGLGLSFESMLEGGTGLTPIATAIPSSLHSGMTPLSTPVSTILNTPIVTSPPSTTHCGNQQRSSSSSPDSISHKLVSL